MRVPPVSKKTCRGTSHSCVARSVRVLPAPALAPSGNRWLTHDFDSSSMFHSSHFNGCGHSASSETAGGFLKKSASAVSKAECLCHFGKRVVRSFNFPSTRTPSRIFGGGIRKIFLDGVPVDVIPQNDQETIKNEGYSHFDPNFFHFWEQDVE